MNYIKLINNYWQLREQGMITNAEGDLYLYLLHTSNKLDWKNPFNQSNAVICAMINVSEPTLIRYRNTLKQLNLIDFISGKATRKNTQYYLNNLSSSVSSVVSRDVSRVDEICFDNTKQKQNINHTKQNVKEVKESSLTSPHEVFVSIKILKERLDKNHWLEQVATRYEENFWVLRTKFFDFCDDLLLKGIETKTEADLKSHFVNLLNLQKEKNCAKKEKVLTSASPKKSKVEQNAEVLQQVLQDIENEYRDKV